MRKKLFKIVSSLALAFTMIVLSSSSMISNAESVSNCSSSLSGQEINDIDTLLQNSNASYNAYAVGESDNGIFSSTYYYDLNNAYRLYNVNLTEVINNGFSNFQTLITDDYNIKLLCKDNLNQDNILWFYKCRSNNEWETFKTLCFNEENKNSKTPRYDIQDVYSLINSYFPDGSIQDVKIIDLSFYDEECAYVLSNGNEYIIPFSEVSIGNLYNASDFINNLDLSPLENVINHYNETGEYIYINCVDFQDNFASGQNAINKDDIYKSYLMVAVFCGVSVVIIGACIIILKKQKD